MFNLQDGKFLLILHLSLALKSSQVLLEYDKTQMNTLSETMKLRFFGQIAYSKTF